MRVFFGLMFVLVKVCVNDVTSLVLRYEMSIGRVLPGSKAYEV